jgi:hypothetical protein
MPGSGLLFSPVVPACGSFLLSSRSCSSSDGRPETMKIPQPTPHRNSPPSLPSPLGRGKRGKGEGYSKSSQEVQGSKSRGAGDQTPAVSGSVPEGATWLLAVSPENRGNKATMYMKIKDKYKKSPSLVALAAGSAVCGFFKVAGDGCEPQTRRSALHVLDCKTGGTKPECI